MVSIDIGIGDDGGINCEITANNKLLTKVIDPGQLRYFSVSQ